MSPQASTVGLRPIHCCEAGSILASLIDRKSPERGKTRQQASVTNEATHIRTVARSIHATLTHVSLCKSHSKAYDLSSGARKSLSSLRRSAADSESEADHEHP
ncbi:MAG: hypothetical protein ACRET1_09665, partial [Burkholderiales bacterium]